MVNAIKTEEPRLAAVAEDTKDLALERESTVPAPRSMARRRAIDLIEEAQRQLKLMTGYPIDSVAEFRKTDDGWELTVTAVELERIPPSTDVLAEYVVGLDKEGDIVDYRRGRRYYRDQVGMSE